MTQCLHVNNWGASGGPLFTVVPCLVHLLKLQKDNGVPLQTGLSLPMSSFLLNVTSRSWQK